MCTNRELSQRRRYNINEDGNRREREAKTNNEGSFLELSLEITIPLKVVEPLSQKYVPTLRAIIRAALKKRLIEYACHINCYVLEINKINVPVTTPSPIHATLDTFRVDLCDRTVRNNSLTEALVFH